MQLVVDLAEVLLRLLEGLFDLCLCVSMLSVHVPLLCVHLGGLGAVLGARVLEFATAAVVVDYFTITLAEPCLRA